MGDQNKKTKADEGSSRETTEREAAPRVPHSVLLDELFNAIQQDGSANDAEHEENDDDVFEDLEFDLEDEEEKNSTLALLSAMRPRLAELFTKA
jgi:hypothetical protein